MHVYSDVQCMQAQRTKPMGQYAGTKCTYKGPIIWAYGDTMHVHMNNPIGTRGTCVYKGPTLRGSDAQIEDQSYEHTMHIQSLRDIVSYAVICRVCPRHGMQIHIQTCTCADRYTYSYLDMSLCPVQCADGYCWG